MESIEVPVSIHTLSHDPITGKLRGLNKARLFIAFHIAQRTSDMASGRFIGDNSQFVKDFLPDLKEMARNTGNRAWTESFNQTMKDNGWSVELFNKIWPSDYYDQYNDSLITFKEYITNLFPQINGA